MKVNIILMSDYILSSKFYQKDKMDFFAFLVINIIAEEKIDKDLSFKEILNDLYIPSEMMYLFNNAYYLLLDEGLLIGKDQSFETLKKEEVKLTNFGKECLKENVVPSYLYSLENNFIYDFINKKICAENKFSNETKNVIVIDKVLDENEISLLLNENKRKMFPSIDESVVIKTKLLEANPLLVEAKITKKNNKYLLEGIKKDKELLELINKNFIFMNFNNLEKINYNKEDAQILTKNLVFDILIGNEEILKLNSNYYFIIDENKAFTVEDNIVYISKELFNDYFKEHNADFFALIEGDFVLFNYLEERLEGDYQMPLLISKKVRSFDFKKILKDNISKFSNKDVVNKIIERL